MLVMAIYTPSSRIVVPSVNTKIPLPTLSHPLSLCIIHSPQYDAEHFMDQLPFKGFTDFSLLLDQFTQSIDVWYAIGLLK